jgi:acetolactate synthase-1/2/3 large subunit
MRLRDTRTAFTLDRKLITSTRRSSSYNTYSDGDQEKVRFLQIARYCRDAADEFDPVDIVNSAEAFSAHGLAIITPDRIATTLRKAIEMQGPVLIRVSVG